MQSTHLDVYLSQNWSVPPMVQKVCRDLLGCRPSEKYYLNDRLGIDALVDERQELIQEIQPLVYNASVDDYLSLSFIFVILLAYALLILCVIAGCFGAKAKRFFKSRKFMLLWSTFTIIYYLRWLLPSSMVEGGFNSLYQQFPNIFEMDTRSLHELCHGNRSVDFSDIHSHGCSPNISSLMNVGNSPNSSLSLSLDWDLLSSLAPSTHDGSCSGKWQNEFVRG